MLYNHVYCQLLSSVFLVAGILFYDYLFNHLLLLYGKLLRLAIYRLCFSLLHFFITNLEDRFFFFHLHFFLNYFYFSYLLDIFNWLHFLYRSFNLSPIVIIPILTMRIISFPIVSRIKDESPQDVDIFHLLHDALVITIYQQDLLPDLFLEDWYL